MRAYQALNMSKIRFGVIGCGSISKKAFIPALINSNSAELVAVASRSINKAKAYADEFNCVSVDGYNALLSLKDIDAVYIATQPSTHEEIIISAAEKGKHVLCEKPLSTSLKSVERIVDSCKKYEIAMLEGFMYQFHPQHEFVNKFIKNNEVGSPVLFEAKFGFPPLEKDDFRLSKELGGGALLDAGVYTIHSARNFFKRQPIDIYAIVNFDNVHVDTHGSILLDFGNNQTAHLSFGFNNYYQNYYSVWCTQGRIKVCRAFSIPADLQPEIIIEKNNQRESIKLDTCNQFVNEIDNFTTGLESNEIKEKWFVDAVAQARVLQEIFDQLIK